MRFLQRPYCLLTIIVLLFLTCFGCEDSADNITRQSLDVLLVDLDAAVSKNSQEELQKVIRDAKQLQATSKTHIQSKNLILATANEKLARLEYSALSAPLNSTKQFMQNVAAQTDQITHIRGTASSFYQAGQPSESIDVGQQIQLTSEQSRIVESDNISLATNSIANSKTQSETARAQADNLSRTAEDLFQQAEKQGLIAGHKSFKQGVKTVRKSQKFDNSAETIEIESSLITQRLLDDARAELEAIALILHGVKNTSDLLEGIRSSSIQNAATLRLFADELDNEVALRMDESIETTNNILTRLDSIIHETQNAIQAVSRSAGNSRDARITTSTWKLRLEWLLGQVEESKYTLLLEERETVSKLIENKIVTSSNKWLALGDTLNTKIEQAADNAIAAYENATELAGNLGKKGELLSTQFNARISVLKGNPVPLSTPTTSDATSSENSGTTTNTPTSDLATP